MIRFILFALLCCSLLAADSSAPVERYSPAERRHWAFQPRKHPAIPTFEGEDWARSPIDAFILAGLKKQGLTPAPAADRRTLIRRVTFDLTGLPPTPAEIDAFVNDRDPRAWEKLIDRLLDSPRYGEKWGQHWLDLVRFAETDGFEYDTHRHDAWRYRDYVIRSFNRDKPYDQFIREQLAGDEISTVDEEDRIAAGFNRLGPLRKNAGNQEVASSRNEVLTEMTNIVGSALLGVTLGCARCHDHKFDPIRQTDYYRMQAFFAATQPDDVQLASAAEQAAYKKKVAEVEARMKALKQQMAAQGAAEGDIEKQLADLEDQKPEPLPSLFSVKDDFTRATPIHVLARGDYRNKGQRVHARTLGVLLPDGAPELPEDVPNPRTKLADWLLAPENPLTARVMVNRIWLGHFGRGIVATPNDFGRMGSRPSHPDLLDYLANRFVESGWKMKALHREILLSNAYRQSYEHPDAKLCREKDPDNGLVWHFERRRLEAEEIRDAALAIAGKLNDKMGGPGVITPADPQLVHLLYKPSQWKVNPDEREHYRRSIYLIAKRNLRLPLMEAFDAPDYQISCPRRESSTHAPQALELLNGDFTNKMAVFLAKRLETEAGRDPTRQVDLAYRLAAGRPPTLNERRLAVEFLKTSPLREFALAVFNLNAFLYVE
ncbi:MAG TPA: DUF1549 and DUF1553 domain-containing protein [Bryobacteraceae bacterium]|nr:DUF1549 and DUF1553 domain-containing protein [Bryobacteraceae bacterium]